MREHDVDLIKIYRETMEKHQKEIGENCKHCGGQTHRFGNDYWLYICEKCGKLNFFDAEQGKDAERPCLTG